jgi:hypothetical protein
MPDVILSISSYAALTFVAAVGILQICALRAGLDGLAWPIGLRYKYIGYFVGTLLVGAFLGGMFLMPLIEPPSPLLVAASTIIVIMLALLLAILGAALRLGWKRRRQRFPPSMGKAVELGPLRAVLYQPDGEGPHPGICLLPDPTTPYDDLSALVRSLVWGGIAVLLFDWRSVEEADRLTLQGLMAVGISYLARWPEIDEKRVGLVGVGLGGDLALRTAAMDPGVAAVLAIEPVLSPRRPWSGLETLSTLSWFEARRRTRRWKQSPLVGGLDALAAVPCIAPRQAAVIVGCAGESEVVDKADIIRTDVTCSLTPAAHTEAVELATKWFKEHLA